MVVAFTLWKPDSIEITKGEKNIAAFDRNPGTENKSVISIRQWCRVCGGHIYTDHPMMGMIDVPAAVISNITFTPGFHVHYQETVHPMRDGLPKFRDLPAEAEGSGDKL
jgi:hypothetical protein